MFFYFEGLPCKISYLWGFFQYIFSEFLFLWPRLCVAVTRVWFCCLPNGIKFRFSLKNTLHHFYNYLPCWKGVPQGFSTKCNQSCNCSGKHACHLGVFRMQNILYEWRSTKNILLKLRKLCCLKFINDLTSKKQKSVTLRNYIYFLPASKIRHRLMVYTAI